MNRYPNESDELLLSMSANGDISAFSELYDRYWKALLAKAFARLKNKEDAEEVVQELFISIWHRRQKIQLLFTFKTYVFASLRYEILSFIAKQKHRRNDISLEGSENFDLWIQDEEFHSLEMKELQSQINVVIDKLPEKCRLIFKMSRNEGLSAKNIASELKISHRTVETQISKAIRVLKSSFKDYNSYILLVFFEFLNK
ncbi:RNA polymerase sigma-70 factor [Pedobacter petrophilus]|uniref:RNA polymerase sigma-70 factor n=1 Tax=Pedobacter petrophilus TaxID=1908241 RepID=A0A7K0FWM2_9SPHI|nr:RNA polymerase sigma-70 factor [Pedobacter petrophilus]MRX75752.1 RNA polymerase sigma-70 factor [Pedobacter petrophilus]